MHAPNDRLETPKTKPIFTAPPPLLFTLLLTPLFTHVRGSRFECFLMKSLRHPNIVKLVGVCWEDSLFACCLEFVENGSLEDWLRRTAGGKSYDPSEQNEKKKKKKKSLRQKPEEEWDGLARIIKDERQTYSADEEAFVKRVQGKLGALHWDDFDEFESLDPRVRMGKMFAENGNDITLRGTTVVDATVEECAAWDMKKMSMEQTKRGSNTDRALKEINNHHSVYHFVRDLRIPSFQPREWVFDMVWKWRDTREDVGDGVRSLEIAYEHNPDNLLFPERNSMFMRDGNSSTVHYSLEQMPSVGLVPQTRVTFTQVVNLGGAVPKWAVTRQGGKQLMYLSTMRKLFDKSPERDLAVSAQLAEVVFKGYDHYGSQYDEGEHTEEDKKQIASMMSTIERFHDECSDDQKDVKMRLLVANANINPWEAIACSDGASCWGRYNASISCGESFARIEVSATPAHIFALYMDSRQEKSSDYDKIEKIEDGSTVQLLFQNIPTKVPGMSNRESLARGVVKRFEGGLLQAFYQVEDERKPVAKGGMRVFTEYVVMAKEKEGTNGKVSELSCMLRINPKLGGLASLLNAKTAMSSVGAVAEPITKRKHQVERLLGEYEPVLEEGAGGAVGLTWKGQLLNIATQCALGVQYLHHEQYWAEEEKNEDGVVLAAGYRQCIIHRDLKPDNMLLTKDWQLKLTDFGEARAVNLNQTMTSVGTPIYVAPEVLAGNHYDATADSYR